MPKSNPSKKHVCFVTASAFTVNAALVEIVIALAKHDWQVTVVVNAPANEISNRLRQYARVISIGIVRPISPLQDLRGLWQLYRLFRREKFHAVHSITPKAGLLAMLAARLANIPKRFHTFTGQVWVTRTGPMRWLLRSLDKLLVNCATTVLTDGPSQKKFLVTENIIAAKHLQILAQGSVCGVDVQRFAPNVQVRQVIRTRLSIPLDAKAILFLGRIHPEKGIHELLQAFIKLCENFADLHLILVGPDEGAAGLITSVPAQYQTRIHKAGSTTEPENYMAAADIFCLPSYREGFNVSLLEAAATGLPSVATRIYGITDVVVDKMTGLLVPIRNVNALVDALARLLNDAALRQQFGTAARQRAASEFSQEVLLKAWLDFYAQETKKNL